MIKIKNKIVHTVMENGTKNSRVILLNGEIANIVKAKIFEQ